MTILVHDGNRIEVSCNAIDGHENHADWEELRSIRRAQRICREAAAGN